MNGEENAKPEVIMTQSTANQVEVPLVGRTENIWLCDQTEIPVASETGNEPRGIQNLKLNRIENCAASDVIACGRTRRTNKYGDESQEIHTEQQLVTGNFPIINPQE